MLVLAMLGAGKMAEGHAEQGVKVPPVRADQAGDALASQYDEITGLWFTAQLDRQGQISSEVKGRDLSIVKSLTDGQVRLEITAGKNHLTIIASPGAVELTAGKRRVRFDPKQATEGDYDAAKRLLAESRVVGRLRAAAAVLGANAAETPHATDLLLTDALVGLLDGDPGAAARIRERVRTRIAGARVVPAAARGGAIGDCYNEYRNEVYDAMMDAERCVDDFPIWNVPMRNLCNLEFTLRSEAAWFEFLGCTFTRVVRMG
jgi:hypothetical protein